MEEPTFEGIEVAVAGTRGELHLNRPEKLNPLSQDTLRDLAEAARWFNSNPDLKVVVVAGRGRAFSSGADVTAFAGSTAKDAWNRRRDADAGRVMADALEEMTAVTIAKIHGHCIGGGVVLAGACDLRLAAEGTNFSIPEVDLGIPLAWGGIPRLVRDIGPALTKELVMTCRPFDAAEALACGFLNRVVPAEQLDQSVEELAVLLESKPKLALLATKRHTNAITEEMVGTMRSWSDADGLIAGLGDPEGKESAARYLARMKGADPAAEQ
ncbi:MAG: enoyl-CoA hydratase/isomerase family protein [Solirubrobacterales bacterium]